MDRPRRPLHSQDNYIYSSETGREYLKFIGVLAGVLLISLILTFGRGWDEKYIWTDFIAVFFIASAAYKIFRLEIFSTIYKSYDVIASRWSFWSYVFPFIELGLGADYLLSNGSAELYLVTILVMAVSIYSFFFHPTEKSHVQYACLDSIIRLPLATINVVEGILMFVAALALLLIYR